jgi:hypothetical protein
MRILFSASVRSSIGLMLTAASIGGAQLSLNGASASAGSCAQSLKTGAAPASVTCAAAASGVTGSVSASMTPGPGGGVLVQGSASSGANPTDVMALDLGAVYQDIVFIGGGPLTNIFRIAANAHIVMSALGFNSSMASDFFISAVDASGIPSFRTGGDVFNSILGDISGPVDYTTTGGEIFGAQLGPLNAFSIFMQLTGAVRAMPPVNSTYSVFGSISTPTITAFDAAGNDITENYTFDFATTPVTATPEPATMALVASGLAGLGGFARRRKKRSA